mgnify:CR=1 FL=1
MKDLKCSVHGTALMEKEVPVFYGMPTLDSDISEINSRFPHHGLWSMTLGGCVISPESPETEAALVCANCHDAAEQFQGKGQKAHSARRYHGSVSLDPTRAGRDASTIADEVIAHLSGLMGADVKVTLEIEANIPDGAPEQVVRTVTENSRTLKFEVSGFEEE